MLDESTVLADKEAHDRMQAEATRSKNVLVRISDAEGSLEPSFRGIPIRIKEPS